MIRLYCQLKLDIGIKICIYYLGLDIEIIFQSEKVLLLVLDLNIYCNTLISHALIN